MTPAQFAKEISALGKQIEVNVGKATRATALKILTDVTLATPVDTGRARANWISAVGAPATGIKDWPEKGASGQGASAAIQSGSPIIATAKPGDTIHVTNNLPYIGRLNNGWSKQAPKAFVEKAIKSAIAALRKAKII